MKLVYTRWYSPRNKINECVSSLVLSLFGKSKPKPINREQFDSGFIDGLRVAFRIVLHIDDIAVLYKIQKEFEFKGLLVCIKDLLSVLLSIAR